MRPATIFSTVLFPLTKQQRQSKSMPIIPALPTRNRSNVRLPTVFSSPIMFLTALLVVLSAIQDILLQLHLRECGLL